MKQHENRYSALDSILAILTSQYLIYTIPLGARKKGGLLLFQNFFSEKYVLNHRVSDNFLRNNCDGKQTKTVSGTYSAAHRPEVEG